MRRVKAVFRYIETELYAYDEIRKELARERDDIIGSTHTPETPSGRSGKSDPTLAKASRLLSSKSLRRMELTVAAIDRSLTRLDEDHRRVFQLYYRQGQTWQEVCAGIPISRAAFFKKKRELVRMVAQNMGYEL